MAKRANDRGLGVEVRDVGGYPCVRMTGQGTPTDAARVATTFEDMLNTGARRLLLDMRDVAFLDIACHDALARAIQRLRQSGGVLVLVDHSLPTERTLKLLSLERLVDVVPTMSQATAYLDWHE
jgi:anti-anti-sigma factor